MKRTNSKRLSTLARDSKRMMRMQPGYESDSEGSVARALAARSRVKPVQPMVRHTWSRALPASRLGPGNAKRGPRYWESRSATSGGPPVGRAGYKDRPGGFSATAPLPHVQLVNMAPMARQFDDHSSSSNMDPTAWPPVPTTPAAVTTPRRREGADADDAHAHDAGASSEVSGSNSPSLGAQQDTVDDEQHEEEEQQEEEEEVEETVARGPLEVSSPQPAIQIAES